MLREHDGETLFQHLGLVTGAADDDPSGIATYLQAGAQLGSGLLWTMALPYPLMTAVPLASAALANIMHRLTTGFDAGRVEHGVRIDGRMVAGLVWPDAGGGHQDLPECPARQ